MKSFADILAEANELTRTHHERAAVLTRAHFEAHPELATGINVERRCHAGWWNAERCGGVFGDAPHLYHQRPNYGYTRRQYQHFSHHLADLAHQAQEQQPILQQQNRRSIARQSAYRKPVRAGRYAAAG